MNKKSNFFQRFNDKLADKLSYVLSIMITFYIILGLVLIPLLYTQPTSIVAWASYLCSVVFQGIALPVLGYTSRKSGDKTDALMEKVLSLTKDIDRLVKIIESQQEHIHDDVEKVIKMEEEEISKMDKK